MSTSSVLSEATDSPIEEHKLATQLSIFTSSCNSRSTLAFMCMLLLTSLIIPPGLAKMPVLRKDGNLFLDHDA